MSHERRANDRPDSGQMEHQDHKESAATDRSSRYSGSLIKHGSPSVFHPSFVRGERRKHAHGSPLRACKQPKRSIPERLLMPSCSGPVPILLRFCCRPARFLLDS